MTLGYVNLVIPFSFEIYTSVIHSIVSLLSGVLGLDNDFQVTEIIVGLYLYLDRSGTTPIRFDDCWTKRYVLNWLNFTKFSTSDIRHTCML